MADFRLREFIVKSFKSIITKSAIKYIFPRNTALQLALSYYIDFGTIKDDKQTTLLLTEHSLEYADLQNQILLGYGRPIPSISKSRIYPEHSFLSVLP